MKLRIFFASIILVILLSVTLAQQPRQSIRSRLSEETIVHRDLPYVTDGHERQKLDLYLPKTGKKLPLIIWIHGGAWLVTEDGLVHVEVKASDGGVTDLTLTPLSIDFEILSLDTGPFPGQARGLAVDEADRVWAVNGKSVLRYSGATESWQEAASPAGGADVVVADPRYGTWPSGVWVAGRGELVRLDGANQQVWPMPNTLTSAPTALLVDRTGRVWMHHRERRLDGGTILDPGRRGVGLARVHDGRWAGERIHHGTGPGIGRVHLCRAHRGHEHLLSIQHGHQRTLV